MLNACTNFPEAPFWFLYLFFLEQLWNFLNLYEFIISLAPERKLLFVQYRAFLYLNLEREVGRGGIGKVHFINESWSGFGLLLCKSW